MSQPPQDRSIRGAPEPGRYVRLAGAPEWGIGQVQSAIGNRVTVNFENAGKRLIDLKNAALTIIDPHEPAP